MDSKTYRTGEFAARASITVRTLRWYDRIGLLKPSRTTTAGHRLYTDSDLGRLEQILALKFLGLSLDEIRECQQSESGNMSQSLLLQKKMLKERRAKIDRVIEAIDRIEQLADGEPDWESIIQVIRVIQMEPKKDWWKKYYSDEAAQKLEEWHKDYSEDDAWRDAARWKETIADLRKVMADGKSPDSSEAQDVARRWWALINEFTMGDQGILEGLQQAYQDEDSPWTKPTTDEEDKFIGQALEIYKQRRDNE
ncbi:MerR family transcriptional regulator [Desmospora profundinema]|uniref:DNA-binding transcriptional MerR regulator n=1 Tax=Desmospora profundinema TaxID=1571184 RepID=A0ABU1IN63_9BACL|nr:MerR family transcriptional regulator [Desmospora profundinema]MDR6226219.1 DNA-binding transcriptional MerR regulator [Desmospora profundinema]